MSMSREDSYELAQFWHRQLKKTSSVTSLYQAFTPSMSIAVQECPNSLEHASNKWDEKGLFISNDLIASSLKKNLMVYYVMQCGTVLSLIVPKLTTLPSYLKPIKCIFRGQAGYKIPFDKWEVVGNMRDVVKKRGKKKRPHLALNPSRGA